MVCRNFRHTTQRTQIEGGTPEKVTKDHRILPELVRTDFKYIVYNEFFGEIESVSQMEFWAGIVGMNVDPVKYPYPYLKRNSIKTGLSSFWLFIASIIFLPIGDISVLSSMQSLP